MALVALTTLAGVAAGGAIESREQTRSVEPFAFELITTARGAAPATEVLGTVRLELEPDPERDNLTLVRRQPLATATPLPTPIAPTETPVPAPTAGTATAARPAQPASQPAAASQPVAATGGGALGWPVPGGSISQYFHAGHLAVDIAAPYGSTVVAASDGVVTLAGWVNNGGGQVVAIDHGNGMVTRYNHLGSIWVTPGQWVARGQGIAGVGCTGICTGPHVHFEVIVNGIAVNPLRYM